MMQYSVCFFGDSGVGKTSLISRIVDPDGEWMMQVSTIGAEFQKLFVRGARGDVEVLIWDLSGQTTYRNMIPIYLRQARLIVLVFDLTNRATFDNLKYWKTFIDTHSSLIPILLVGNKCDLIEAAVVNEDEALKTSGDIGAESYFTTSARTGDGVPGLADCIREMAFNILASESLTTVPPEPIVRDDADAKQCGC
jgi:small GTP-binding protein